MDKFTKKCTKIKIFISVLLVLVFFVIGLAFFARPKISESEKRTLTKFPSFTVESFLSGEYTSQVSLWFSDTYPLREQMLSINFALKELYGIKGEQLLLSAGVGGETVGGYYVKGNTAYELYVGTKSSSDKYISVINKANDLVGDKAQVYDIVIPLHYSLSLSQSDVNTIKESINLADNKAIIDYIYSNLDSDIKTVDAYSALKLHSNEYIYFRADHHWTARGAYYAYQQFCNTKGITPTSLSSFKKYEFGGFLGTLYEKTNRPSALSNSPDKVEAFVPIGTNSMTIHMQDGTVSDDFEIVCTYTDRMYQHAASKYNCFIAGDNPLTEIHNKNKTDGSSVVIIKESYGNAFVPFLVDSYEYVYVIDYRYWSGSLSSFVEQNDIDDVIFLNVINATAGDRAEKLDKIIK